MRRWWIHAGLYGLLLVVVTAVIPVEASFGGDDGAYGGQVYALQDGTWALERPLAVVDDANEGWLNSAITPDGPLPYTISPSYAVALSTAERLGTDRLGLTSALALQLLPVAGALAAAVVAWLLARTWQRWAGVAETAVRGEPGLPVVAFWLVALGPVLVNGTTLWAHTLSTAAGGLAVVFLLRLAMAERAVVALGATVGLSLSLAAGAALRTEALFWVAAVGLTGLVLGRSALLPRRGSVTGDERRRARRVVSGAVVAEAIAGAAWLANRSWGASLRVDQLAVETRVEALGPSSSWLASRIPAAWRLLLSSLGGGPGPVLTLLALGLAVFGALRLRRPDPDGRRLGVVLLVASAGIYALRVAVAPGEVISGTLGAWPVLVVLLIVGAAEGWGWVVDGPVGAVPSWVPLAVPVTLLTAAVLVTQYSASGGLQWGGRYLSMAFVPAAVLAAAGGQRVVAEHKLAVLALAIVPAVGGAVASYRLHANHERVVDVVTAEPSDVVVTEINALPRIAWTALPTAFYVADESNVEALLVDLASAEVASVNVQGFDAVDLNGTGGYELVVETPEIRHLRLVGGGAGSP